MQLFPSTDGKMEQTLPVYGLRNETVTAIMMVYSNNKAKVRSSNWVRDFFDIVAGVLQEDINVISVHNLPRFRTSSIDRSNKKKWLYTKKKLRHKRYPDETITNTDYEHEISFLANTLTQSKYRLHSLEQVTVSIGFYVNSDKMEYMGLNQRGDISALNSCPLNSVDKFTYPNSSVWSILKKYQDTPREVVN